MPQNRWRCFIAIPLHERVEQELQDVSRDLGRVAEARGVRVTLTRPEGRHLTLAFLGDIEEAVVAEVDRALLSALAGVNAFAIDVCGLLTLPPGNSAKVVAANVSTVDAGAVEKLTGLFDRVQTSLEPLGFQSGRRPFRPHITLARIRQAGGWRKLKDDCRGTLDRCFGTTEINRVVLFRSHLGTGAARYEAIRTYFLTKP